VAKKVVKKVAKIVVKSKQTELTGAIQGKVMNDTGIIGDGCLVK